MVRLARIAFQEIDHAEPRNQFRRPGGVYRRAGDRGCLPDGRPLLHQTRRNTGRIRRTAAATAAGNTCRKVPYARVPKNHSIALGSRLSLGRRYSHQDFALPDECLTFSVIQTHFADRLNTRRVVAAPLRLAQALGRDARAEACGYLVAWCDRRFLNAA